MSQSSIGKLGRYSYSKSLALPACGIVPTLAILDNAGGLPRRGGGVVLPSKGRTAKVEILSTSRRGWLLAADTREIAGGSKCILKV